MSIRRAIIFLAFLLVTCDKPPEPAATTRPAAPLICVVSGLGDPQLGDVAEMLRDKFPAAQVRDFGTAPNSYRTDLAGYLAANPHGKLTLVAHSYGVSKCFQVLPTIGPVELFIDLDGVKEVGQAPFVIPSNVKRVVVITGDFSGLIREPVHGAYFEFKIHAGHSPMAHAPETLAIIEREVRGVAL